MTALFGDRFRTMEAALAAREKLQVSYASNIANADTPNYKADRQTFEQLLAEETARRGLPSHIGESVFSSSFLRGGITSLDPPAVTRLDGNTVDTQKEMVGMAENQLMHELTMRLLRGKIQGMLNTIKEIR